MSTATGSFYSMVNPDTPNLIVNLEDNPLIPWYYPLYDYTSNCINPGFFDNITMLFNIAIGVFASYQLFKSYNSQLSLGNPFESRSCGVKHFLKIECITLQIFIHFIQLLSDNGSRYSASNLVVLLIILPLHIIEPTRSIHQLASLLFYWLGNCIIVMIPLIQDFFSNHPILNKSKSVWFFASEIVLCLNTYLIFLLQTRFWKPSKEMVEYYLLNDADLRSIRNILSHWTFTWVQSFITEIYLKDSASIEELPRAPGDTKCEVTLKRLENHWNLQLPRRKPLLLIALLSSFNYLIVSATSYDLIDTLLSLLQPLILQRLILYFSEYKKEQKPIIIAYFLAVLMLIVAFTRTIVSNQSISFQRRSDFIIQSSLMGMIYKKIINLNYAKKTKKTGDILNHASMDVALARSCIESIQKFIEAMIKLILCVLPLYKFLGPAIWGVLLSALITIPLAIFTEMSLLPAFNQLLKYRDQRTSIMNDILLSIKGIKLYAREEPMLNKLNEIRLNKELKETKKIGLINSFVTFVWGLIPFFMMVSGLVISVHMYDQELSAHVIFPTLSVLASISNTICDLPRLISYGIQARKSFDRLASFFLMDEFNDTVIRNKPSNEAHVCINMTNSQFSWTKPEYSDVIDNSNVALSVNEFNVNHGETVCLVGKFGSGKTTLLRSLLGEMYLVNNTKSVIEVRGSIAYCPQNPCIIHNTIRENILFGLEYDPKVFWEVIELCQLHDDLNSFPHNDKTVVSEGESLSGGQKSRISLARAIYSRSDIYLFDDILASIDLRIGKLILENILGENGILRNKTVLFVTNSISVIEKSTKVVFLRKGKIIGEEKYQDFGNAKDAAVTKMIKELNDQATLVQPVSSVSESNASSNTVSNELIRSSQASISESSLGSIYSSELEDYDVNHIHQEDDDTEEEEEDLLYLEHQLTRETSGRLSFISRDYTHSGTSIQSRTLKKIPTLEETIKGKFKSTFLIEFLRACHLGNIVIYLLLIFLMVSINTLKNYSLTFFPDEKKYDKYIFIYFELGILKYLIEMVASYFLWTFCITGGLFTFHDKLIRSIIYSPLEFFQNNSNGRIMNRFTNDLRTLDMYFPINLSDFVVSSLNISAIFVVLIINIPMMLIFVLIMLFVYLLIRLHLSPTIRELQRLQSAMISPVLSHIQETIQGLETLRAYNQINRYDTKNTNTLNNLLGVEQALSSTNRWLAVRLELISNLITFLIVVFLIHSLGSSKQINPEILGLLVTYSLTLSTTLDTTIKISTDLQAEMISLERIMEYINLETEDPLKHELVPYKDWPREGSIKFVNFTLKYANSIKPVLKNINCEITPGTKVSLVGKTGAGKSTFTLAIFRLLNPMGGKIEIDGINIAKIGLYELRHKLSIVPQGSQTIIGSVRDKLDPCKQFNDDQLRKVLELVKLKNHVQRLGSLDVQFDESGNNFSLGQKNLLSLARSLLVPSKILVLDEATSSLDLNTVRIIRDVIKNEFQNSTIITIAHRLDTIMDSDKVLLLENGEVVEFDLPLILLKDANSKFFNFCAEGLID